MTDNEKFYELIGSKETALAMLKDADIENVNVRTSISEKHAIIRATLVIKKQSEVPNE